MCTHCPLSYLSCGTWGWQITRLNRAELTGVLQRDSGPLRAECWQVINGNMFLLWLKRDLVHYHLWPSLFIRIICHSEPPAPLQTARPDEMRWDAIEDRRKNFINPRGNSCARYCSRITVTKTEFVSFMTNLRAVSVFSAQTRFRWVLDLAEVAPHPRYRSCYSWSGPQSAAKESECFSAFWKWCGSVIFIIPRSPTCTRSFLFSF